MTRHFHDTGADIFTTNPTNSHDPTSRHFPPLGGNVCRVGVPACRVGKDGQRTAAELMELRRLLEDCARAGIFTEAQLERAEAMRCRDDARAGRLIRVMWSMTRRCDRCEHFRRPGLSNGYCTGDREDLVQAYALLRRLPVDRGARCRRFVDRDQAQVDLGSFWLPGRKGNSSHAFALVAAPSIAQEASDETLR